MNPNLREFWGTPSRYKVLYGGRSSSKSWDAAANAIRIADYCKVKILCTRQFQNKIEDSVYSLLVIQIERFGLESRFEILKNKIRNIATGSEFHFYGIQRNLKEIKSFEGADILWMEEAEAVTEEQLEILEPTIRKEGSEIWVIFNPRFLSDFAWQYFVATQFEGKIARQINYNENPFLSSTMLKTISQKQELDPEGFEHIYLGRPKSSDTKSIIKYEWIEAAIDAHIKLGIKPSGTPCLGFDIADDGDDTNATVERKGLLAYGLDEWSGESDELLKSSVRAYNTARERNAKINYDSIGVGASAGSKFKEINDANGANQGFAPVKYAKFNAGSKKLYKPDGYYDVHSNIKNRDKFANLKAQSWWLVADRFRNTYNAIKNGHEFEEDELIAIDSSLPNIKQLMLELSTPRKDVDADGKDKVESKKDLQKRGVKSPNLADAFIMAYARAPGEVEAIPFMRSQL